MLALSSYSDREYVHRLIELGVVGYLLKSSAPDDLLKAVREVYSGNAYFDPAVRPQFVENYGKSALRRTLSERRKTMLTVREAEVLQLIVEGQPNKQIASELNISFKTVEKHRQQLMYKLNIHDVAGLTRYAISRGIIQTGLCNVAPKPNGPDRGGLRSSSDRRNGTSAGEFEHVDVPTG